MNPIAQSPLQSLESRDGTRVGNQVSYAEIMDLYQYVTSNPVNLIDPDGLSGKRCGSVKCKCDGGIGNEWVVFYGEDPIAYINGSRGGCVTLPDGIHCTMPCAAIPGTKAGQYIPGEATPRSILNHECCHVCDLKQGLGTYIGGAIREPLKCEDNCNKRAKDAEYYLSDPKLPRAGEIVQLPK